LSLDAKILYPSGGTICLKEYSDLYFIDCAFKNNVVYSQSIDGGFGGVLNINENSNVYLC
jgi:hypothetical protein